MSNFTHPLNNIKVASPCSADWSEMIGNERARFCGDCKLNVYNLSGMSQREAENLLLNSEGNLCVRFYRRADGTVLTKDCPVGWRAVKQRVSKTITAFASLLITALSGIGLTNYFAKPSKIHTMETAARIETAITSETFFENSNIAVQEKQITTMGNVSLGEVSIENLPMAGQLVNVAEVKQELRKKRKR